MNKIIKHISKWGLATCLIFTYTACDEALDINTDPLASSSAAANVVLPGVLVDISNTRTSELNNRMLDVPQQLGQCFSGAAIGGPSSNQVGNSWVTRYTSQLGNLLLLEQDALEQGPTSYNVAAVSIIMQAFVYHELTLIFEDVPFSEALDPDNFPAPSFDSQEDVLRGIVTRLDEAKNLITQIPADGTIDLSIADFYFNGDMDGWNRFATSLQIRALMLLRNRDNSVDTQLATLFGEPYISANSQSVLFPYSNSPANENPLKQVMDDFFGGSNEAQFVFGPTDVVTDMMNLRNDPRRQMWFTLDTEGGYDGVASRGFPNTDGSESLLRDDNVVRGDLPDIIFTPAEITLYRAEMMADGGLPGGLAAADTEYRAGARLAVEFWNTLPGAAVTVSSADIDTYIAGLPDLTGLTATQALEAIYEQQYLETYLRSVEAWTMVRRTGYPALDAPPASPLTTILKRFFIPVDELATNPSAPASSKPLDDPMWFENIN